MRAPHYAVLTFVLVACSSGSEDGDPTSKPSSKPTTEKTPSAAPSATPPASASVKIESDKKPGIEARVKQEVDNRADGITGTALAPTGAAAALQRHKDWTETKGDFTAVTSADKKVSLSAGTGGSEKLETAATALGLTACEWNPAESVAVGKDKLAGSAADGLCTKGSAKVKAAMVTLSAEKLLVVGAWEDGGDDASMFGAMRSIVKSGTSTGGNIAACCKALEQNSVPAPPEQKGGYLLAIGACKAALSNKDTAAALRAVQAAAKGIGLPAECK
jgi:hypothetical protein